MSRPLFDVLGTSDLPDCRAWANINCLVTARLAPSSHLCTAACACLASSRLPPLPPPDPRHECVICSKSVLCLAHAHAVDCTPQSPGHVLPTAVSCDGVREREHSSHPRGQTRPPEPTLTPVCTHQCSQAHHSCGATASYGMLQVCSTAYASGLAFHVAVGLSGCGSDTSLSSGH